MGHLKALKDRLHSFAHPCVKKQTVLGDYPDPTVNHIHRTLSQHRWTEPEFSGSQVRLVLYRDQDFKGRSLLFDSKAVHRAPEQNEKRCDKKFACSAQRPPSGSTEEPTGPPLPKYTFSRPGTDTKMLEEMVFGAVGMAFRGSTLKVHTIRTPPQLMVTKVFVPSRSRTRESGVEGESLDYSLNSSSIELAMPQKITPTPAQANPSIAQSVPMDVPSSPQQQQRSYEEPEDSGFSTSGASSLSSLTTSIPRSSSSSSINSSSYNSMTRRWRRNQQTSLEHSLLKRQSDEGVYEQPAPQTKRPVKVGMAVIISLSETNEETARMFQNFFFSHITLIEGHVNKLKVGVEGALYNRKAFAHLMVEALESYRRLLVDLYLTPRLQEPVWLDMMCYTTHRVALCQRFLREFMTAVTKYDTKQTNFFLSTLITAVLTNHLAWVPTVTPAGAAPARSYLDKHSAKWLDAVAKSHPYNPLWAQLGDLYGALGFPLRLTRTVVVGRKSDLVNKFLYILSYFIRCSEVLERQQQPYDFNQATVQLDPDPAEFPTATAGAAATTTGTAAGATSLETGSVGGTCTCGNGSGVLSSSSSAAYHPLSQDTPAVCARCQANRTAGGDMSRASHLEPWPHSPTSVFVDLTSGSCCVQDDSVHVRLKRGGSGGEQQEERGAQGEDPGGGDQSHTQAVFELHGLPISNNHTHFQALDAPPSDATRHVTRAREPCCIVGRTDTAPELLTHGASLCEAQTEEQVPSQGQVPVDVKCEKDEASSQRAELSPIKEQTFSKSEDSPSESERPVCRMSPTWVKEDPETMHIRHVGRQASSSPSVSPVRAAADQSVPTKLPPHHICDTLRTKDVDNTTLQDCDNEDRDGSPVPERCPQDASRESEEDHRHREFSHDSGMYDIVVPPPTTSEHVSDKIPPPTDRDSGVSLAQHPHPESTVTDIDQSNDNPRNDIKAAYRVPPVFEHSTSMFDEYFVDETQPDSLSRNLSVKPAKSLTERFKRMASIEGSSNDSLFDEYMSMPCPDISRISETSKISFESGGEPEDTSMFDEYFSLDSGKSLEGEASTTQQCCENQETEESGADDTAHMHLADRRKAPRPDCLVMKPIKKDEEVTPRPRHLSGQSTATLTPARTRSVTPTELSRRRHASSLSNASSIEADFFLSLKEVDMPTCEPSDDGSSGSQSFQRNFGRSLLAGSSSHYLSDFVLHGTSDNNIQGPLHHDLTTSVKNPVLDEQISEAVCIVADVDNWSVKLQKCRYDTSDRVRAQDVAASPLVCNIIESVHSLWKLKMSPEFCLMHLEDRLQEIFFKSRTLAEYLRLHKNSEMKQLATVLRFDVNDIPLLLAVAGTHTPLMSMALL